VSGHLEIPPVEPISIHQKIWHLTSAAFLCCGSNRDVGYALIPDSRDLWRAYLPTILAQIPSNQNRGWQCLAGLQFIGRRCAFQPWWHCSCVFQKPDEAGACWTGDA
jgi:hypothetical protein